VALFQQNRRHVLIRFDLSDDEVQRRAEADRRVVDPSIQVDTATWSRVGQLDWWLKERQEWGVVYADGRQRWIRAVNGRGLKPLTVR
jgi:hypothetical protein